MSAAKKQAKKTGPVPHAKNALDAAEQEIVALIAAGTGYRGIAKKFGVGLSTVFSWIEADPERSRVCAGAREIAAVAFDEMAESEIRESGDQFEFMKAKELAVHYRWRAKAANPKRYGDKTQIDANINITADALIKDVAAAAIALT